MKLKVMILFALTVFVGSIVFAQSVDRGAKGPIPDEQPISMNTVQAVLKEKNAMLDQYQMENAHNRERIDQLIAALTAKQAELDQKQPCSSATPTVGKKQGSR